MDLAGYSVVLGTASRWRRKVFESRFPALSFECEVADIDEKAITAGYADRGAAEPQQLTTAIANAKADALQERLGKRDAVLITSDQVLLFDGHIREKPTGARMCREYLRSYERHPAVTVTAVVVTNLKTGLRVEGVDVAKQHFTRIPDLVIEQLIAKGDVLYCAGGITVEDPLVAPYMRKREGTLDSILGLPVSLLKKLVRQAVAPESS